MKLWDGYRYCNHCVSAHSQRLAEFAQRNRAFVDVVEFRDVVRVWTFALSLLVFLGLMLLIVGSFAPQILAEALILALVMSCCIPGCYVLVNTLIYPQTLRLANGIVRVHSRIFSVDLPFSECHWTVDYSFSHSMILPIPMGTGTRAILLQYHRYLRRGYFIVCVNDARYELLADFLTFVQADG